jgi:hypothetical protein
MILLASRELCTKLFDLFISGTRLVLQLCNLTNQLRQYLEAILRGKRFNCVPDSLGLAKGIA